MTRSPLAPGYEICPVINGGWQLATDHGNGGHDNALDHLLRLVDAGFHTFDCADIYTGVEDLLGELRRSRPDIQVHTKLVPDQEEMTSLEKKDVEAAVDRSLVRLGAERIDLVQLHWWDFSAPGYVETAIWLGELRDAGKIRLVGLTNFDVPHLREITEAGVPIATNQVQYSLLDQRPENGMVEACRELGIRLLCYGVLAGGFLSGRYLGAGAPAEPLANRSLTKYRLILDEVGGWDALQARLEALQEIARQHHVSLATVAARWILDRPTVTGVILGAATAAHADENLRLFELELNAEDRATLESLATSWPGVEGDIYSVERQAGGPHEAILRKNLRGH